jgi:excisionase family DNA binding protein
MAQGMEKGGSSGAMATELAVGLSIAQQIMQRQGGLPNSKVDSDLLSPADVARSLGVPEQDVLTIIESGELAAKRIGTSFRVKRSELDAYLSR